MLKHCYWLIVDVYKELVCWLVGQNEKTETNMRLSWADVHLLMIKDLLWQFLSCKTREPCPCKYVRDIQIPQQHVPFFATWSQVTTNEAKACLMQHKSDRNRTLQSTHPCAWSYPLYMCIIGVSECILWLPCSLSSPWYPNQCMTHPDDEWMA